MDWRLRKYYVATFSPEARDMRVANLKLVGEGITIHFNGNAPKQPDEAEERGNYQCVIGCTHDQASAVEYVLRKAERNDRYCRWKEIKSAKEKNTMNTINKTETVAYVNWNTRPEVELNRPGEPEHEPPSYPDVFIPRKDMPIGWICPKCGRSLAPHLNSCPFCRKAEPLHITC